MISARIFCDKNFQNTTWTILLFHRTNVHGAGKAAALILSRYCLLVCVSALYVIRYISDYSCYAITIVSHKSCPSRYFIYDMTRNYNKAGCSIKKGTNKSSISSVFFIIRFSIRWFIKKSSNTSLANSKYLFYCKRFRELMLYGKLEHLLLRTIIIRNILINA